MSQLAKATIAEIDAASKDANKLCTIANKICSDAQFTTNDVKACLEHLATKIQNQKRDFIQPICEMVTNVIKDTGK